MDFFACLMAAYYSYKEIFGQRKYFLPWLILRKHLNFKICIFKEENHLFI